jgi:conjugal transfer pilus assembly protein TraW
MKKKCNVNSRSKFYPPNGEKVQRLPSVSSHFFGGLVIIILGFSLDTHAKDLGVHGHIFEIQEPDLLKQISQKLKVLEENGTLAEHKDKLIKKAKKSVSRPQPLSGIIKATEDRTFTYDPSLTVPYDLKDHKGRVFHKAGTRVNPLQYKSLTSALIFIDADDQSQIAWAHNIQVKQATKVILTSGSPLELMESWKTPVYFDQGGTITKKLGIRFVPAIVVQDGLKLKISEVALKEDTK